MQVLKLSQSEKNTNFNARYKIPMSSKSMEMFERHVIPMHKSLTGKPLKAFYSLGDLFVFTGNEDVALFMKKAPRQDSKFYNLVQRSASDADFSCFKDRFKNVAFEPLKDLKELINKLL